MTSRAGSGLGTRVLVHHAGQQRLVKRSPVDADANRLLVFDRAFHHDLEVVVILLADGGVAGIDTVLGQRPGRRGILLQQQVPVVMKVADDGDADTALVEALDDVGHSGRGFLIVDRDANNLGAGQGQGFYLLDGGGDVRRICVGHRLHNNGDFPSHSDLADPDCGRLPALNLGHTILNSSLLAVGSGGQGDGTEAERAPMEPGTANPRNSASHLT